jgi:hypothetical protein
MDTYESVEIPFFLLGDQQVLSRLQVESNQYLVDFIRRFPGCFEYQSHAGYFVFWPDGDSPHPVKVH